MEKNYTKFESLLDNSSINAGNININLAGLTLSLLANAAIISLIKILFTH
jgi:hypothetical protein